MLGMRYGVESQKIRPFGRIFICFGVMKKEEDEGLAPPSLPGDPKEEKGPAPRGVGEVSVAIPLLHGEGCVLIDPQRQVMVIPLHLFFMDFLDELGLLLHQKAKQNYRTKGPWHAAFSVSPFQAHAALGSSREFALETTEAVERYLGSWARREYDTAYALFVAPLRLKWTPKTRLTNPATIKVTFNYQVYNNSGVLQTDGRPYVPCVPRFAIILQ